MFIVLYWYKGDYEACVETFATIEEARAYVQKTIKSEVKNFIDLEKKVTIYKFMESL